MRKIFFSSLLAFSTVITFAQSKESFVYNSYYDYNVNRTELHNKMMYNDTRIEIVLPQIGDYKTLKADLHIHTVFSDGVVWPTARVEEAWCDGLDIIALTEHTTEKPFNSAISGDANTSYEAAKAKAEQMGIMLIKGTEITRDKEVGGHLNALFIEDATKLLSENTDEVIDEAARQGAYIIWNHPGWDIDSCIMFEPNERWIKEGKVHAVEVFNEAEWYPRALSWTKDYNIAPTAATDIHGLNGMQYRISNENLRPMTLIFAKENSQESVREALDARRTLAFFYGNLAGSEKLLNEVLAASIEVEKVAEKDGKATYRFVNKTDIPFELIFKDGKKSYLNPRTAIQRSGIASSLKELPVKVDNLHTYEFEVLETTLDLTNNANKGL